MRLAAIILVAFAMLVSPLVMTSARAAGLPHGQPMAVTAQESHHCDEDAGGKDTPKSHMSCAAACAAYPEIPSRSIPACPQAKPLHLAMGQKRLSPIKRGVDIPPPRTRPRI